MAVMLLLDQRMELRKKMCFLYCISFHCMCKRRYMYSSLNGKRVNVGIWSTFYGDPLFDISWSNTAHITALCAYGKFWIERIDFEFFSSFHIIVLV